MFLNHAMIFDEVVPGDGVARYSMSQWYEALGAADAFAVHACVTFVSGTPTLTVQAEHSGDGMAWVATASPEIDTPVTNDGSYFGCRDGLNDLLLSQIRLTVRLTGVSSQARVKLYATGRVRSPRARVS